MELRNITCIVCPLGCAMTANVEDGRVLGVSGNSCKRGEAYAFTEVADPRRTLTTTMRVEGGEVPLVSVKTDVPVPKATLLQCMRLIDAAAAKAPVAIGDVLIEDILGTGSNIVATCAVSCEQTAGDENAALAEAPLLRSSATLGGRKNRPQIAPVA